MIVLCAACDHEVFYEESDVRKLGIYPYIICPECGAWIPIEEEKDV